ncbi:MAG: hypothetical protein AWU57_198 [Marinobacter sp. T13-3]|nr:MAG: hypothetical protein AWU57_198 [Marinobacter sp. T13-3]
MSIQISSNGYNIKRLRSDAKKLAKAERLPLHEAQNRVAEQAGEGGWDAMMASAWTLHARSGFAGDDLKECGWGELAERSPAFIGLYRKAAGVSSAYPYYELIDLTDLFDQLHDMDEDDWAGYVGECSVAIDRYLDDTLNIGGSDTDIAAFNRFRFVLGHDHEATWNELGDSDVEKLRGIVGKQSLAGLAQFSIDQRKEAVDGWFEDEWVDVDDDLAEAEVVARRGVSEADCVFDPMVSIGAQAWSAKVYSKGKDGESYLVVANAPVSLPNGESRQAVELTAEQWKAVWGEINERAASPVGDAASLEVLQEVIEGDFVFVDDSDERINRWLDEVTGSHESPKVVAAKWSIAGDFQDQWQDDGTIAPDSTIEDEFGTTSEDQERLEALLLEEYSADELERRIRDYVFQEEIESLALNEWHRVAEWNRPESEWRR